jgi:hypothetical protein
MCPLLHPIEASGGCLVNIMENEWELFSKQLKSAIEEAWQKVSPQNVQCT